MEQQTEISGGGSGRVMHGSARWIRWVVIFIVGALAVWYVCDHFGRWKDRFVARKFRTVEAGRIYASGQINRHLIRQILIDNQIKEIVCLVADDPSDPDVAAELQAVRDLSIKRFDYSLSGDGTGDIHAYAEAVARMKEAVDQGKPILVHCSSGAQRSNGAVYFYRVLVQGRTADDAAAEMIRNGHNPSANPALIPYLNSHIGELSALLVRKSVIDHVPNPLPQIHHE